MFSFFFEVRKFGSYRISEVSEVTEVIEVSDITHGFRPERGSNSPQVPVPMTILRYSRMIDIVLILLFPSSTH